MKNHFGFLTRGVHGSDLWCSPQSGFRRKTSHKEKLGKTFFGIRNCKRDGSVRENKNYEGIT